MFTDIFLLNLNQREIMKNFKDVVKELRLYLSNKHAMKILDKDVASALEMSAANFATLKRRNSMPYAEILLFCHKEKLCVDTLFFEKL